MARLRGRLSSEQLKDLDSLVLELKELNGSQLHRGKAIPFNKIVPLSREKNDRLWTYIKHISKLVVMYPGNINVVRSIAASDDTTSMQMLVEDATIEVAIWVYRFAWRQYEHSDECGYLFKTADFGFMSWKSTHKNWRSGKDSFKDSVDEADNHNDTSHEDGSQSTGTHFSEMDFPLSIEDLESSITNP